VTPDLVQLIETLQKLGVPAIVLISILILPKLVPAVLRNINAKTKQNEKLTETMPRIEAHLSKMAGHGQASEQLLLEIRNTQKRHEMKLDKLLGRGA